MTARVYVIAGDELIPFTREDVPSDDIPLMDDPDKFLVLNADKPEPIGIMLYDPRYRIAYCETCGWTRWVWTGSGFKCPCKCKDKATPPRGPLTVDATR